MAASDGLNAGQPRIKLLYILDEFPDPYAGTERQFWLLLQGLDRERIEAGVLLLRPSTFLQNNLANIPVRVLDVPRLRSVRGVVRVLRAAWWARRSGYRLAHIFLNDSSIVFPLPLKLAGLKVIVSRRDLGIWYTCGNLPILRFQARFVDIAVANCNAVRDVVVRSEHMLMERVRVIHNGTSRKPRGATSSMRSALNVPEDAALIVIVGNLRPLKRIDDAVRALARLDRPTRPAYLVIVGEDRQGESSTSHRSELETLALELGVVDRVRFTGKMSDPMPAILAADICVLSSETEGLSNVIIEYMIAGKPVVCTDVGGNAELVIEGETGHLVRPRDVAGFSHAIAVLLDDPARAAEFGVAGQNRAAKLFTASAMVERHVRLYRELLDTSPSIRSR